MNLQLLWACRTRVGRHQMALPLKKTTQLSLIKSRVYLPYKPAVTLDISARERNLYKFTQSLAMWDHHPFLQIWYKPGAYLWSFIRHDSGSFCATTDLLICSLRNGTKEARLRKWIKVGNSYNLGSQLEVVVKRLGGGGAAHRSPWLCFSALLPSC